MNSPDARFQSLIQPIEELMLRSIWRIVRDPDDGRDALQQALETIWRRLDRVERHPNPRALMLKICVDSARDGLRRRMRRMARESSNGRRPALVDSSPSPHERLAASEQNDRILAEVGRLPRRQATVFLMRVVQERPYSEIAQAIGCRESTARAHFRRARSKLRQSLADLAPDPTVEVSES